MCCQVFDSTRYAALSHIQSEMISDSIVSPTGGNICGGDASFPSDDWNGVCGAADGASTPSQGAPQTLAGQLPKRISQAPDDLIDTCRGVP
jgi:hypothetical protein